MYIHTITTHSPNETCLLAQNLASHLQAGDTLLLSGDVGAGKTFFARCLINALLNQPEDIPSPTFTLIQTYTTQTVEIWHSDLYRLSDIYEIEELGLTEAFHTAICLVEWPDRLGSLAPNDALHINISVGSSEETRDWQFGWGIPSWSQKLKGLVKGVS